MSRPSYRDTLSVGNPPRRQKKSLFQKHRSLLIRKAYRAIRAGTLPLDREEVLIFASDHLSAPVVSLYDSVTGGGGYRPRNALTDAQVDVLLTGVADTVMANYSENHYRRLQSFRAQARWGAKKTVDLLETVKGLSKREQARILGISTSTVGVLRAQAARISRIVSLKKAALDKNWRRDREIPEEKLENTPRRLTIEEMRERAASSWLGNAPPAAYP